MKIVLPQCIVRPWRLEDAPALPKYANNRNVWLRLRDRFPHPYTIENAKKFLELATAEQPPTKFCIEVEDEIAGGIGLQLKEDVHRHVAEIGYWLGEPFWGRGLMSDIVVALGEYAFANFSLRRIQAEVFSNNPASARVLEKAGFVFEGRMQSHVEKNGAVLDSLVYAKVRTLSK